MITHQVPSMLITQPTHRCFQPNLHVITVKPLSAHFARMIPMCVVQAREANRYLLSLLERPLANGREFPVVRGQEDTELYR